MNNNTWEEALKGLIELRDSQMYGYWKSVFQDGFEGGYPIEWNKEFISAISKQISEAEKRGYLKACLDFKKMSEHALPNEQSFSMMTDAIAKFIDGVEAKEALVKPSDMPEGKVKNYQTKRVNMPWAFPLIGLLEQTYDVEGVNHDPIITFVQELISACCNYCKCTGTPMEVQDGAINVACSWHEGDCHDLKCICHQSRTSETRTELASQSDMPKVPMTRDDLKRINGGNCIKGGTFVCTCPDCWPAISKPSDMPECPPHNLIDYNFTGAWSASVPPPNKKCTKCLMETRF